MKDLTQYLLESTNAQKKYWAEQFVSSLENTQANKDFVIKMLANTEFENVKALSDYLLEKDKTNYIAYQPADDEFLSKSNQEKIISQISDYLLKYIIHK